MDDTERSKTSSVVKKSFPMTRQQAEKAAGYIVKARESPDEYELFGKNCIDLAQGAMDAAELDTRVDEAFSDEELNNMGTNRFYGAGDEAQRRGRIVDVEKEVREFRDSENTPFGPHAESDRPSAAKPDEVSEVPEGVGLGAEAARNAAEDAAEDAGEAGAKPSAASDAPGTALDAVPDAARAKAMAIVAGGKDGKGSGNNGDDLDELMLKPVDDLTGDEAKALGRWAWKLPSSDPRRLEVEDRRRDFYRLNYGDAPAGADATGRMIEPGPVRHVPEKPKDLATPNGEPVAAALKRFADKLARPVHDDGETNVVKALQGGLSMLGEPLKVDGVSGPKTQAALKRTLARHGAGRAEDAFGIGRFKRFAETERDTGGSASGLKRTVENDVQPLFGKAKPKIAAEVLQESINDLNARMARERNAPEPEPLKIDGDIGPKTTDAFRAALAENGPEKLTKSYTSMLGFAD